MAKRKNQQRCKVCSKPLSQQADTVETTKYGTVHRGCVEWT